VDQRHAYRRKMLRPSPLDVSSGFVPDRPATLPRLAKIAFLRFRRRAGVVAARDRDERRWLRRMRFNELLACARSCPARTL